MRGLGMLSLHLKGVFCIIFDVRVSYITITFNIYSSSGSGSGVADSFEERTKKRRVKLAAREAPNLAPASLGVH